MWGAILTLLSAIADYFRNKQLIDAGKSEEALKEVQNVQANVEKAKDAVSTPDAARTERLRDKYDRSRDK